MQALASEDLRGSLFGFEGADKAFFLERKYAPLAQLVEQLTLNQWVPGSNP